MSFCTIAPGRIDIRIFSDGSWIRIGGEDSYPPTPEARILPQVQAFASTHVPQSESIDYSGFYGIIEPLCNFRWELKSRRVFV